MFMVGSTHPPSGRALRRATVGAGLAGEVRNAAALSRTTGARRRTPELRAAPLGWSLDDSSVWIPCARLACGRCLGPRCGLENRSSIAAMCRPCSLSPELSMPVSPFEYIVNRRTKLLAQLVVPSAPTSPHILAYRRDCTRGAVGRSTRRMAKMTLPTEAKSWTSFVRFEPIAKLSSHHQILFWFFLPANTLKNSKILARTKRRCTGVSQVAPWSLLPRRPRACSPPLHSPIVELAPFVDCCRVK